MCEVCNELREWVDAKKALYETLADEASKSQSVFAPSREREQSEKAFLCELVLDKLTELEEKYSAEEGG